MGLIPSINTDLIKLATRAVDALERIADGLEEANLSKVVRRRDTASDNELRRQLGLPLVKEFASETIAVREEYVTGRNYADEDDDR